MNNRFKNLKWNSILALCYQVVLVATGLLLPRCFLHFYGSAVNGLISSITQFLSFINICDLGISAVISSAYYGPLARKDAHAISKIFVYSRKFFRVVGLILVAYLIFLLAAYPTVINTDFDYWFTFALIFAMGISHLGQYFVGISYQLLLNSDQKSYVQLSVNAITLIANTVASVVLMVLGASIQVVKLTTSLIYLLRPIAMWLYVRRHYKLDFAVTADGSVVSQKRNGIIQHIAYMVYENTDIIVLTVFSTLQNVSIYSVYTLATNSIKQVITAATTGVQALLGNMIANKENEDLYRFYSFYRWGIHTVSSLLFTVTGLLIVPFVSIYTANITDADYHAPIFAILITIAYYLSSIRNFNYALIRAAGHYKQTQRAALTEAALNLTISVICVFKLGLVGVAIGTVISTLFFVIYENIYFAKNIIFAPTKQFIKQFAIDILTAAVSISLSIHINVFKSTVMSWFMQAILVTALCACVSLIAQLLFNRKNLLHLKTFLPKMKR